MERNEKAEFAVKILLEYAKENRINGRDTTDLSPLEKWLILRLYNVVWRSEQLLAFKQFLQSEYHLPVSNRMVDEFEQKQSS